VIWIWRWRKNEPSENRQTPRRYHVGNVLSTDAKARMAREWRRNAHSKPSLSLKHYDMIIHTHLDHVQTMNSHRTAYSHGDKSPNRGDNTATEKKTFSLHNTRPVRSVDFVPNSQTYSGKT
jgi:hypothetical protein